MDFPGHFQHIFQQLNLQRLHAQLCDCVVEVGSHKFHAHRSILAACSSHFKALLSSGEDAGAQWVVDKGGGTSLIALDPEVVTPEAFSTLLDMIYTSNLSLTASNVMDVLLAASHLHLNAVVKACKLHLSRKNFPSSAPKGWRSVPQQQPKLTSVKELDEGGVEVSQSGEESSEHKRKPQEDRLGDRKRICRMPGNKECSPTVTRSTVINEERGEEAKKWGGRVDEVEEKYGATMSELEEIQLPSQSDSSARGAVKVKVGDEDEDEPKMETVEVKKEMMTTSSPNISPSSLLQHSCGDLQVNGDKISSPADGDVSCLQTQLCSDLPENDHEDEGIDSLSELALSCFLNPANDSETGAMDEEESLASLTAAATAAAAASDAATSGADQQCPNASSAQACDATLLFPVTTVPLQPLLPTQSPGFSDTLVLRPAHNSLTGFLSVEHSRAPKGRAGSSGTAFRRIAPKVVPGSEADPSGALSSGPAGNDRAPLTRASEDVLSKCKKAAAEDNVLLVEGEKKYACKICSKTFMNLTDCKKHIRVHTGEKPYPCPKCGKRFSQSSHLYKHSKNSSCVNWKDEHAFRDTVH
ncbi:zinc finger and BTB domain-containing protein 5-like [Dunckerocampus dactyliophorus]|uniref:zinc finger and BTB domain-containing protein 5-like n=1 Tax=Dunckerocampus dactyliophorus TaxID=161453 RepID=UPI00240635AA|nr:zinc finger and BTB domain-containing protein 5-like [Dunckerocampus dactyliophorus]